MKTYAFVALLISISSLPTLAAAENMYLYGLPVPTDLLCDAEKRHTFRNFTINGSQLKNVVVRKEGVVKVDNIVMGTTCPSLVKTKDWTDTTVASLEKGGEDNESSDNDSGRESQREPQSRSAETTTGETTSGPNGTTDAGGNVGFGAISG